MCFASAKNNQRPVNTPTPRETTDETVATVAPIGPSPREKATKAIGGKMPLEIPVAEGASRACVRLEIPFP